MADQRRQQAGPQRSEPTVSIEDLHRQLKEAVDRIETGEQWQAWLDFAQRLHRYSFNNLVLIWAQNPAASAVAGYRTWQSMGRQVRRGERAIRVLAPNLRRVLIEDEDGRPKLDADGRKQYQQRITGFRPAPVFDVSQTDGPPIPEPARPRLLTGQAPAGLWDALAGEIAERGYRLLRAPAADLGEAVGRTNFKTREVWVRDDVDAAQAVKTLAHELAHILLHADHDDAFLCRGVAEVEAESVAHLVAATHQLDTGAYTFPYVAHWAYPVAAAEHLLMSDIVTRTGDRVMKAAGEIINLTSRAVEARPESATVALAARVNAAAHQTAELRDQAVAAALPAVERRTLLGVVADSQDFYVRQLATSWAPGYLAERGLAGAVESHELGYAPRGWTELVHHLCSLGYTDDHIEAAGMATRARTGQLVDRMRDRLIVPLRDCEGDLVGFIGRAAPDTTDPRTPKYFNTPTTAIFSKAELLYGLAEQRAYADSRRLVLCEGPLDAIAVDLLATEQRLPVFGVAASGTAFTRQHAAAVNEATGNRPICLAYDADQAGTHAAEATWKTITETGPRPVTIAELPDGSDPASLYATEPAQLARLITDSRPAGLVVAERQIDAANLTGHAGREVAAFRHFVALIERMPPDERVPYALMLANRLHIDVPSAAALVAEVNPHLLMDSVAHHCQELGAQLQLAQQNQQAIAHTDTPAVPELAAIRERRGERL